MATIGGLIVCRFQEHDEDNPANPVGTAITFTSVDAPLRLDLPKSYHDVNQPGVIGGRSYEIDTPMSPFEITAVGPGENLTAVRTGVYKDMLALRGKRGTLTLQGVAYSNIRLRNVSKVNSRGGTLPVTLLAGAPTAREAEEEAILCEFLQELE